MLSKLTLLIEEENIAFAKEMAVKSNRSVSKLVNEYFIHLKEVEKIKAASNDPFIKDFAGLFNSGSTDYFGEISGKRKTK